MNGVEFSSVSGHSMKKLSIPITIKNPILLDPLSTKGVYPLANYWKLFTSLQQIGKLWFLIIVNKCPTFVFGCRVFICEAFIDDKLNEITLWVLLLLSLDGISTLKGLYCQVLLFKAHFCSSFLSAPFIWAGSLEGNLVVFGDLGLIIIILCGGRREACHGSILTCDNL